MTAAAGVADARPHARGNTSSVRLAEAESLLRTGHYEEARPIATAVARSGPDVIAEMATVVGARAEIALGLYDDARHRLENAAEAAPDSLSVRDALMRFYELTGNRGALAPLIDRTYEDWKRGRVNRRLANDLIAVATASRLDDNWMDANGTLRDAVHAPQPTGALGVAANIAANLDWGWIFLEKHSAANAEQSFRDVLKVDERNPDAHVALARVVIEQRYDVDAAEQELGLALTVNPRHAGALAMRGELALDAEEFAMVAARVAEIRRTNPRDGGAAALAAAAALVLDDRAGYER